MHDSCAEGKPKLHHEMTHTTNTRVHLTKQCVPQARGKLLAQRPRVFTTSLGMEKTRERWTAWTTTTNDDFQPYNPHFIVPCNQFLSLM